MAERRIIEGRWTCSQCDTEGILGRHKVCPNCGSPREADESAFTFGERAADGSVVASSASDDLAEVAAAGEDWHCRHCDAANRRDAAVCRRCGATREGDRPPPPEAPVARTRSRLPLLGGLMAMLSTLGATCAGCLGIGWLYRDVEVVAEITARTWVRQVQVERLTPAPATGWKDALPAPAQIPGSGSLREGLGAIESCQTLACWPRPPQGKTTARITGRHWKRSITTRRYEEESDQGWRTQLPKRHGVLPVAGSGGTEGVLDQRCHTREKTPERCRQVSHQEPCGTERRCRVKDLGNGFAEEICEDIPKTCTVQREECTPAVMGEWCEWTALVARPGRSQALEGRDGKPRWPALTLDRRESERREQTNTLELASLAGPERTEVQVDEALLAVADGTLVYVGSEGAGVLPDALQARGDRVDCGDGIPRGQLANRDRCTYTRWAWVQEPKLEKRGASTPTWPDGKLGDDGRESRAEWVEVDLAWKRGEKTGTRHLELETAAWEAWKPGTPVPVVVDSEARFVRFPEE